MLSIAATGNLAKVQPRAVVDLPEFIPHFYVLVEVQEERETATILGKVLRPETLMAKLQEMASRLREYLMLKSCQLPYKPNACKQDNIRL